MKKIIIKIMILSLLFISIKKVYANTTLNLKKQHSKKLIKNFAQIKCINVENKIINSDLFILQIEQIKKFSPALYVKNKSIYTSVINWLKNNSNFNQFNRFGIHVFRMKELNKHGNVKITGYYTPIFQARKKRNNEFKYPIYSIPIILKKNKPLPKRKDIYNGILDKKYILAYSNSLVNNLIMEIQGSALIDYGDNTPLSFFSYAGQNGWPYKGIGQVLINQGDIRRKHMSMQAIKNWCNKHTEKEVKNLFEQNQSFIFFKETTKKQVYGASSVPLVEKTSVAVDTSIIKSGSVILLQIPLLNKKGIFIKKYEMRLVVALDVGGAIKGQHFDFYQGSGEKAGMLAGYYNHYGCSWILHNNLQKIRNIKYEYNSIRNYS